MNKFYIIFLLIWCAAIAYCTRSHYEHAKHYNNFIECADKYVKKVWQPCLKHMTDACRDEYLADLNKCAKENFPDAKTND